MRTAAPVRRRHDRQPVELIAAALPVQPVSPATEDRLYRDRKSSSRHPRGLPVSMRLLVASVPRLTAAVGFALHGYAAGAGRPSADDPYEGVEQLRMVRIARILLIAMLSFPLLTGPAFAECAWVLWQQTISDNPAAPPDGLWTPRDSFTTNRPCALMAESMTGKAAPPEVRRGPTGFRSTTFFVCLPDTVDPRGPKGK